MAFVRKKEEKSHKTKDREKGKLRRNKEIRKTISEAKKWKERMDENGIKKVNEIKEKERQQ